MTAVNPLVANLLSFMRGLRHLNFDLTQDDFNAAVHALTITGAREEGITFEVLSALWCKNYHEVQLFRTAFLQWMLLLRNPRPDTAFRETYLAEVARRRRPEQIAHNPAWLFADAGVQPSSLTIPVAQGASRQEVFQKRRIDRLNDEELRALMALYRPCKPLTVPSHLARPALSGDAWNPQETMRRGREGSEWVRLYYNRVREEPLTLTLLLDMSGSMGGYHRPLLQFVHAMMRHQRRLSVYAFSTRLSSLTRALRYFHVDRALAEVSDLTPDRGGGTRIAESLEALWKEERGRGITGRSTLVLISDGLEEGTGEAIEHWMMRWRRFLGERIYWWNPFDIGDPLSRKTPSLRALARHAAYAAVPTMERLAKAWQDLDGARK